jgi:hypothetical protein
MHENICQVVFSFVRDQSSYLSILLTCKLWLEYGYKYLDFTIDKNELLIKSCKLGSAKSVIRLLQNPKVDLTDRNQAAIRYAAKSGHIQIVDLLLQDPRGRAPPDGPEGR